MKQCKTCGCEFPATTEYFHKDKCAKDGLRASCKICVCDRQQIHYINHAEQERQRKYNAYYADPDASRRYFREYNQQRAS